LSTREAYGRKNLFLQHDLWSRRIKMREKVLITIACLLGVSCVAYGMIKGNNAVFFLGILMVIGAYLCIRKKLRATLLEKEPMEP
jgi:nicotinamide riboside transporter PnuC